MLVAMILIFVFPFLAFLLTSLLEKEPTLKPRPKKCQIRIVAIEAVGGGELLPGAWGGQWRWHKDQADADHAMWLMEEERLAEQELEARFSEIEEWAYLHTGIKTPSFERKAA